MSGSIVKTRPLVGFAFEQKTVSNSAQTLTQATYKPSTGPAAESAFVTCHRGEVRYRYDGTDPTATVGHILSDGGYIRLDGMHQIESFKAIRAGSVDAELNVTYERE